MKTKKKMGRPKGPEYVKVGLSFDKKWWDELSERAHKAQVQKNDFITSQIVFK